MEFGNSTKYNDKPLDEALLELKKDLDNGEWNFHFKPDNTAYISWFGRPATRKNAVREVISQYMSGKTRLSGLELWEECHRQMSAWIVIKVAEVTQKHYAETLAYERRQSLSHYEELTQETSKLKKWNTVLLILDILLAISLLARCLIG